MISGASLTAWATSVIDPHTSTYSERVSFGRAWRMIHLDPSVAPVRTAVNAHANGMPATLRLIADSLSPGR